MTNAIRRKRSILAVATMSLLWVLTRSTPASTQSGTFTVRDAIEMQTFIDPYPFNPAAVATEDVKYSLDHRLFAVVTQRGLISTNELECSAWVFNANAVRQFLSAPNGTEPPSPRRVVRMAAVANDPCITELRWLPGRKLAFLGRNRSPDRSLFTVDVETGALNKLTPDKQDVIQFDLVNDTVVYTTATVLSKAPKKTELVMTGSSIYSQMTPESPDDQKTATLWVIRGKKNAPSRVIDARTHKPIQLMTDMLALAPSGRAVVVTQHTDRIPEAWEAYEPFPGSAFGRLKPFAETGQGTQFHPWTLPEQYAFVDLATGRIDPIDAPLGESLGYFSPMKAIWAHDGRRVLLLNTFVPLRGIEESEKHLRVKKPCVALVDTFSRHITCVASVDQSGREEYQKDGTSYLLSDVTWNENVREIVLTYATFGAGDQAITYEHPPEKYRLENDTWKHVDSSAVLVSAPLWAGVRQDLNEAPVLCVGDQSEGQTKKLWEPNPQLKTINLGDVSVYQWRDQTGREWIGGLIKPPNYKPGQRYPLVIQTHGFNRHEFMTVGAFTTAFAARPLAARGIVVLQVGDEFDLMDTPREAPVSVQGYEAAIDHLTADGLVDPERAGIIGFSRTGYYALEALTKSPKRFAAATIADSDFLGYMQQLLTVDLDEYKKEGIAIYGSQPFGDGLKAWIEKAPAFNLDKIVAPVRIEVHDLDSLLGGWEAYAGLRLQDKPVDLIQLPEAAHEVTKPLDRLASEQEDVDWFDFWLNGYEDPDPTKADEYRRWHMFRRQRDQNLRSLRSP